MRLNVIFNNKSHFIELSQKRLLSFILFIFIFGAFLAGSFFMFKLLQNELDKKLATQDDLRNLLRENAALRASLSKNNSQILKITQEISDLEQIVQTQENREDLSQESVNLKNISTQEKELLLAFLPSIDPIKSYKNVQNYVINKKQALSFSNGPKTPVFATASGVVELKVRGQKDLGTYLVISHGFGFSTFYSGLGNFYVKEGEVVKKGAHIADTNRFGSNLIYQVRFL